MDPNRFESRVLQEKGTLNQRMLSPQKIYRPSFTDPSCRLEYAALHNFCMAERVLLSREAQLALLHSGHPPRRNCFDRGQPLSWFSRCLRGSHERERERERETERPDERWANRKHIFMCRELQFSSLLSAT